MLRYLFIAIGTISLIVGLIGVFVPLLPTTPFILLSATLFARSSKKFHGWLLNNKYTGPIISNWEASKTIPKKAKALALATVAISMVVSVTLLSSNIYHIVALALLGLALILFISKIPTTPNPKKSNVEVS